jgi:glucose/arabinose dehydrogenase
VNDTFPRDRHHGWKYIAFGPDDWLYVPVGAPCNVCEKEDERYRHQIFVAEHGSWNRSVPVGYRITRVQLEGNRAIRYEVFADGWLQGTKAWGRPVDILIMKDGALLVSDDRAGAIYRIAYNE